MNRDELPAAVKLAFGHDDRVIIEENISGFEVSCAVLGNDKLIVGELGEIELADGFFDYKEKYTPETYSFRNILSTRRQGNRRIETLINKGVAGL